MEENEYKETGRFDMEKARQIAQNNNSTLHKKANAPLVEVARDESIQPRFEEHEDVDGHGGSDGLTKVLTNTLGSLFLSGDTLPPWWSAHRDSELLAFWRASNLLAGAMYTMTSKMTTIPFHIEPRDPAITSHFREAARFEKRLKESAEGGKGWGQFFSKQIQSLLGQDNGRFMEIIDLADNKAGPVIGPAISVAHLDPSRCRRTGNVKFPVTYHGRDGKRRKLHWTRVAFGAQLPSDRIDMYGVGLCAVSRSSSYARNMLDISQYKEEKLGSRPVRGVMLAGGGLDGESVGDAFTLADGLSDSRGLQRYAQVPIIGDPSIESPTIELITLSSLPDNFDEQEATDIAMAAIALAFGVDARELWPGLQRSATRADALLSHIKQRGKGPGQIIAETERMFDNWYLPPFLKMVFDFQDDAQDRQRAEISRERALKRKVDLTLGVTNDRVERQSMVKNGELSTDQFKDLELQDGRLPNGKPLDTLFFEDEPIYTEILTLSGISDPTNIRVNDPEKVLDAISVQRTVALEVLSKENRQIQGRQAKESLAALDELAREYEASLLAQQQEEMAEEQRQIPTSEGRQGDREGPKANREDESAITEQMTTDASIASENSPRELKQIEKFEVTQRDKKGNIKEFTRTR